MSNFGHYLYRMSRVQALLALQGLPADVKRKIFAPCFPKRAAIVAALQQQHETLPEYARVDETIIDFAHAGQHPIGIYDLTRAERKWAHLRCDFLGLQHESSDSANGRVVVVSKGAAWVFAADKQAVPFQWGYPSRRVKLYECEYCGEVSEDPELLRYYHRDYGNVCEDCRYGDLDDE